MKETLSLLLDQSAQTEGIPLWSSSARDGEASPPGPRMSARGQATSLSIHKPRLRVSDLAFRSAPWPSLLEISPSQTLRGVSH